MPLLSANNTELYYESRGEGPSLLLIMGATGCGGAFERLAELLADEFTVVTYDRRGNGRSPRPPSWETTSPEEQADDAAALLDALGLGPADRLRHIRSYLLEEKDGRLGTVCFYEAESPQALAEHARAAELPCDEIVRVGDIIVSQPDPELAGQPQGSGLQRRRTAMPRYLTERFFEGVGETEFREVAVRAERLPVEEFPDLEWEHSHVCVQPSGEIKSFCVYKGPNEERIREHAEVLGYHAVLNVYEIAEDVTPADVVS